jgi:acyl-CoA synthetase (AMP-forming)/AMP-acid ligase II
MMPMIRSGGTQNVGGASLARGYRGQPETTTARFIEHASLGRVYRTGDLVHRDARGDFHYHGRIDAQVKLRGYRIELGAVEARLAAHPSVLEAACTVEGEGAQRRLVAHAVARSGATIDESGLRAALARDDVQLALGKPRVARQDHAALRRQVPNPVISSAGVQGLRTGVKYLIELGYFKDVSIDSVLDLRHQPA